MNTLEKGVACSIGFLFLLALILACGQVELGTATSPSASPSVHVAFCERVYTGPRTDDYALVLVWSDGEIWTAPTSHLKSWTRITTVNHQGK